MIQRLTRKRFTLIAIMCLLLAAISSAALWYFRTDPLTSYGATIYSDPSDGHTVYTIELINESLFDIEIKDVTVNYGMKPDFAKLGVTYDSTHLVQYFGEDTYPNTKFIELNEIAIKQQLTPQQIKEVMANLDHSKQPTPIFYGIAIRYDKEPIQEVTIHYKYLGFTKTKKISEWFD